MFLNNDKRPAEDKQAFNVQFVLTCSAPWVSHPQYLDLMFTARQFLVAIDPSGLAPGAHTARAARSRSNPTTIIAAHANVIPFFRDAGGLKTDGLRKHYSDGLCALVCSLVARRTRAMARSLQSPATARAKGGGRYT